MRRRTYAFLFIMGLLMAFIYAFLQTNPGYFDAFYYFYGGQQIASGAGFQENFLWNYLADPAGVPYPSFTYWMPLPSLAAALGIRLFSGWLTEFDAAQLVFIFITAFIPPLTAALSFQLSKNKKFASQSGILAGFLGLYTPFITATDAFAIYMVLGASFFLAYLKVKRARYLVLGIFSGLFHISRADGILWLGVMLAAVVIDQMETERFDFREVFRQIFTLQFVKRVLVVLVGYLLVMLPWYLRNLDLFGSLMPPGNSRTLWVLDYAELYSFPASILTPARWWDAGIGTLLQARGDALIDNLKANFFTMGMVLPGMLAVLGVWRHRRIKVVWLGWVAWGTLFVMMTLAFPFSGMHGSYFHSGAAFVPLVLAFTPIGIDVLTGASLRKFKSWKDERIRPFYTIVLIIYCVGFSLITLVTGTIGSLEDTTVWEWNESITEYTAVGEVLTELGVPQVEGVITANSPGFIVATGRPSYNVPNGGVKTVLELAEYYDVHWVLVEESHPTYLDYLFDDPRNVGDLKYIRTIEGVHLFRIED